jgi:F0F1-type ATP synthase membrane subunit b/b'
MESTLHDLGRILLNGIPTFVLVLLLNFYLRAVFFKPLEETLAKRYEMTEGARKVAAAALAKADERVAEHQAALRMARAEVYESQEKLNRQLDEQHGAVLKKVHVEAEGKIRQATAQIAAEAEAARRDLAVQSDALAEQIANTLLKGKAA